MQNLSKQKERKKAMAPLDTSSSSMTMVEQPTSMQVESFDQTQTRDNDETDHAKMDQSPMMDKDRRDSDVFGDTLDDFDIWGLKSMGASTFWNSHDSQVFGNQSQVSWANQSKLMSSKSNANHVVSLSSSSSSNDLFTNQPSTMVRNASGGYLSALLEEEG